jgi:hypothetical protein
MSEQPFARYRSDPAAFFEEQLRMTLYSRQLEIVEAVRDHERVAVRACNGSGKTAVAAGSILWWLGGGPGSIVVSTATTEAQVRRVLWREVAQRYKPARDLFHGATVTTSEIMLGADWFAVGLSADQTEAIQGFHGSRVLVIIDEASGVDEAIFEAVEGLLAGGETRLLLIGNPLRTSGTFFDAFHSRRDEWHTIAISAYDTPNLSGEKVPRELRRRLVSRRWVERLERQGADSNAYRVRVLGEFPSAQDDAVVALENLEKAHAADLEPGLPFILGVDVARFGSDKTQVALREGNRIRVVLTMQQRDLMHTAGAISDLARRLSEKSGRRPTIVVDDVGLGGGVTDRLRELREFRVVDFNGGRAASSKDYPNKRSELWFTLAEVLPLLDLDPRDDELAADLLAPSYSFASDGARVVESKANTRKRLRRSPDRADAVMLTLAVDPPRVPGRPRSLGMRVRVATGVLPLSPPRRETLSETDQAALAERLGSAFGGLSRYATRRLRRAPGAGRANALDRRLGEEFGIDRWSVERGQADLAEIIDRAGRGGR